MKKLLIWFLTLTLLLVSCTNEAVSDNAETTGSTTEQFATVTTTTPESTTVSSNYELCHCGEHYFEEVLRPPTPPLHIHEMPGSFPNLELLAEFEIIYEITFVQWDTEIYDSLVIWTDEPIKNVMFVSLGSDDSLDETYFYAEEILHTVDELLPGDALLLSVAFQHYLIPRGGFLFTDGKKKKKSMVISESMRGGCFPRYSLSPYEIEPLIG
jgi:hypothetical protein